MDPIIMPIRNHISQVTPKAEIATRIAGTEEIDIGEIGSSLPISPLDEEILSGHTPRAPWEQTPSAGARWAKRLPTGEEPL